MASVSNTIERRFIGMALEIGGEIGVGDLAHAHGERIPRRGALNENEQNRENHPLRYRRWGSSTSRIKRRSVGVGGSTQSSDGLLRSFHPTPARISSTDTPGYSAVSTNSPFAASRSKTPLSVITLATRSPGLVTKSTRSGNVRGEIFETIRTRWA